MRASLRSSLALFAFVAGAAAAQEAGTPGFVFEGNQARPAAELEAVLAPERERWVREGFSEAVLDDAAFLLERHYRRLGFRSARVEYELLEGRRVVYRIDEGTIWGLAGPIEFEPPIDVPGFDDFWQRTSDYARDRYFLRYPLYDENQLANDLDLAKDFLAVHGYADVRFRVEATEAPPLTGILDSDKTKRLAVVVRSDLGPRTLLGSVSFEGDLLFTPVVLLAELGLHPWPETPVPFYPDQAIKWKIALVRFYRGKGHYKPDVSFLDPSVSAVGPGQERADLVFRIVPGPAYRIRNVRVQGNEDLSTDVILDAFGVEPGDAYSLRRIEEGRNDLIRLDLFSTVAVVDEAAGEDEVDLVVLVEEKPWITAGISLGFGLFDRVRAGAEIEYNNLLGTGRGVRARGSVSARRRFADLKFIDPLPFGDSQNRIEVGPYVERQEREPFVLHRLGCEFLLEREIGKDLTLELGWNFERSDVRHLGDGLDLLGEGDHWFSGPLAGLEWDHRNDPVNPTAGWRLGLSVEESGKAFGATKDLLGAGVQAEFLYPIETFQGYPIVLYTGYRGRVVQPIFGARQVPIQKRLFEGGENSVRSFEPDRLSPLNDLETPVGGEVALVATVEVRFNIYRDLWGVVFADVGLVDGRLGDFGREEPGWGFGPGLRYQTPIGPIRLEAAFNPHPDRSDDDDLFEIVFTIGFDF